MTDIHSFALGFVGILSALTVARALGSLAALLAARHRFVHCPIVPIWLTIVLFQQVHWWWGLATFEHLGTTYAQFLVTLGSPVAAYLALEILGVNRPDDDPSKPPIDLVEHYRRTARGFFVCAAIAIAFTIPQYLVIVRRPDARLFDTMNLVRFAAAALLAALAFIPPVRRSSGRGASPLHYGGAGVAIVGLATFIVVAGH